MRTSFKPGDVVKFKDGQHESFVMITQAQFDKARAHFNSSERKPGDQTVLVEEGEYEVAHPGNYMYVAACRPNHQLMMLLGQNRNSDGRFTCAFVGAGQLDIVE